MKEQMDRLGLDMSTQPFPVTGGGRVVITSNRYNIVDLDNIDIFIPPEIVAASSISSDFLLFLYRNDGSYAVFEIVDIGGSVINIVATESTVEEYVTEQTPVQYIGTSTVQSSIALDRHAATVQTAHMQWVGNFYRYGKLQEISSELVGDIRCYKPNDGFAVVAESEHVYKGAPYYGMYEDKACGSRQSALVVLFTDPVTEEVEDIGYRNLSARLDSVSGKLFAEYDTKDGHVSDEIANATSNTFAIISPSLRIGSDSRTVEIHINNNTYNLPEEPQYHHWSGDNAAFGSKYFMGEHFIEYVNGARSYGWLVNSNDPHKRLEHHITSMNNGLVRPMDYANYENTALVGIYLRTFLGGTVNWVNTAPGTPESIYSYASYGGTIQDYFLAYRCGNIEIQDTDEFYDGIGGYIGEEEFSIHRIKIAQLKLGTTSICDDDRDEFGHLIYTNTSGFDGTRIVNVSCFANQFYVGYTYVLQAYNGIKNSLLEIHFNDTDDELWTFQKRIVGLISVTTGIRSEFELSEEMLGEYVPTFNMEIACALGLHHR
jgi:hypothetical protein